MAPEEALGLGLALSGFSVVLLGLAANWLAAAILAGLLVTALDILQRVTLRRMGLSA